MLRALALERDEGVAAGELSPVFAGTVYCAMIDACQEVLDFARASAWTTALTRWCDSQPDLVPFTGQCAVHRGQILRLHAAYPEALADPHTLARQMVVDLVHPGAGPVKALGVPVKLSETPGAVDRPAPLLGQHTAEILTELGYTEAEQHDLRARGIT